MTNQPKPKQGEGWEKRFAKEFPEGSFVTHAIHTSYGGDKEPLDDERRKKIKAFIALERSSAIRETVEEACTLIDKIESSYRDTTMEEWKAFKHIRNAMRDELLKEDDLAKRK